MAKSKKLPPPQVPPSSSSSAEEEEDSDTQPPLTNTKPTAQTQTTTQTKPKLIESESESESEDEDDSSGEDEDVPKSQAAASSKKPQPVKAAPSRPASESESESEDEDEDEVGKSQPAASNKKPEPVVSPLKNKKKMTETSEKLYKRFERIFTLDDEITILTKLGEYQAQNGPLKKLAHALIEDLHGYLKKDKSLSVDVSSTMLFNKIRALKKKYLDARNHKSDDPHDLAICELGKTIWGDVIEASKQPNRANPSKKKKSKGRAKPKDAVPVRVVGSLKRYFPLLMASTVVMGNVLAVEMLGKAGVEELMAYERKLKMQKVEEMKLNNEISEFIIEKARELMD